MTGRKHEAAGRGPGPGTSTLLETVARALQRPPHSLQVLDPEETGRLAETFRTRWRVAADSLDPERALATSTPDRLVIESLLAWLAARLPPRQPLTLIAHDGEVACAVRSLAPEALVGLQEMVSAPGQAVHLMFPDGAFGLALEMAPVGPGRPPEHIFKLFVWGAPR